MTYNLQVKYLEGKWQIQGDTWLLLFIYNHRSCVIFQKRTEFKYYIPLSNHALYHVPASYLENMMTTHP